MMSFDCLLSEILISDSNYIAKYVDSFCVENATEESIEIS